MIKNAIAVTLFLFLNTELSGKTILVYFNYSKFRTSDGIQYLEIYLKIPATNLRFIEDKNGGFKAGAGVRLNVSVNDSNVYSDSYNLLSPTLNDTQKKSTGFSLLDLQKIFLSPGKYLLEAEIFDVNFPSNRATLIQRFEFDKSHTPEFSKIILEDTIYRSSGSDAFTRGANEVVPLVNNILDGNRRVLRFYCEHYSPKTQNNFSGSSTDLKIKAEILDKNRNVIANHDVLCPQGNLCQIFDEFDISTLPTGFYSLILSAIDDENDFRDQTEVSFIRVLEVPTDEETIDQILFENAITTTQIKAFAKYLQPIESKADIDEFDRLRNSRDSILLKHWFYDFWASKGANPSSAFSNYSLDVTYVNKFYKTPVSEGFQTDRGRILLKYGKPDYVAPYIDDPESYPYEIWHYYKIASQTNVRFIFYIPTQLMNDYILLHSDLIGETLNPGWRKMIYRRTSKSTDIDDTASPHNYGNELEERLKE